MLKYLDGKDLVLANLDRKVGEPVVGKLGEVDAKSCLLYVSEYNLQYVYPDSYDPNGVVLVSVSSSKNYEHEQVNLSKDAFELLKKFK